MSLLTVSNSNSNVASFEQGKLKAKAAGTTTLTARCGGVYATKRVSVYSGYFAKGGTKYGVEAASGYYYMFGQSQPQEMEIKLTNYVSDTDTQHFKVWIKCSNLGKEMDITRGLDGSQISVYKNQNQEGYSLPYDSEGKPVVVQADWSYTNATLTKGQLKVSQVSSGTDVYSIKGDFSLSNGYTFSVDWEGNVSMKREG